jgi:hypothetical protein
VHSLCCHQILPEERNKKIKTLEILESPKEIREIKRKPCRKSQKKGKENPRER